MASNPYSMLILIACLATGGKCENRLRRHHPRLAARLGLFGWKAFFNTFRRRYPFPA